MTWSGTILTLDSSLFVVGLISSLQRYMISSLGEIGAFDQNWILLKQYLGTMSMRKSNWSYLVIAIAMSFLWSVLLLLSWNPASSYMKSNICIWHVSMWKNKKRKKEHLCVNPGSHSELMDEHFCSLRKKHRSLSRDHLGSFDTSSELIFAINWNLLSHLHPISLSSLS